LQQTDIRATTPCATRKPATAHASTATNRKDFRVGNVTVLRFVLVSSLVIYFQSVLCSLASSTVDHDVNLSTANASMGAP